MIILHVASLYACHSVIRITQLLRERVASACFDVFSWIKARLHFFLMILLLGLVSILLYLLKILNSS